jgi:hypothetical protein
MQNAPPPRRVTRQSLGANSAASDASEDHPSSGNASPHAGAQRRAALASAPAASAAVRVASFLSGASPSLPLHAAWQQLLGGFAPALAEEAQYAVDTFLMCRGDDPRSLRAVDGDGHDDQQQQQISGGAGAGSGSRAGGGGIAGGGSRAGGHQRELTPAGKAAVEALMGSIDQDILTLVELTAKGNQVMAVPMLASTRVWLARLNGCPAAAPLIAILTTCERRLAGHWQQFVAAQTASVDAFDGRSKMGLQGGG